MIIILFSMNASDACSVFQGVAPFRAFLQQRRQRRKAVQAGGVGMGQWRGVDVEIEDDSNPQGTDDARPTECKDFGDAVLFFGCRHPEHDYLYKQDIQTFLSDGMDT